MNVILQCWEHNTLVLTGVTLQNELSTSQWLVCVSLCHQLVLSVQYSPFRTLHYGRLSGMCLVSGVEQLIYMSIVVTMDNNTFIITIQMTYLFLWLKLFVYLEFLIPGDITQVYAHTQRHTQTHILTSIIPMEKVKKKVTLFSTRY